MSARGWVLFAAMALIWGIPYLLIKVAVTELPPAAVVFGRTALGALLLLPIAATRHELRPLLARWRAVLLYTCAEIVGPWILLSYAETRLSSSLSGLLIAGVPLVGAILAWILGHEDRPGPRGIAGLVVGFVGVGLVVGLDVATDDLLAVGEVGLVVLGYALGAMIIGRYLRGAPSVGVIAVSLTISALVYLPVTLAQLPSTPPSLRALGAVALLGLVCTALAFLLFFALIHEVGSVRATVITYFNPAVAIVLGVLLLGEPFTLSIAAGFALILLGSFVATHRAARPRTVPTAPA
ncbi:MAG: DMT family transporter [Chloroflexota bacterium]|nr:DMT family transporter [Chloroflexota bacterium]